MADKVYILKKDGKKRHPWPDKKSAKLYNFTCYNCRDVIYDLPWDEFKILMDQGMCNACDHTWNKGD